MKNLLRKLIVVVLLFSIANLIPTINWLQEVNKNLGSYYFIAHIILLPAYILLSRSLAKKTLILIVLQCFMIFWYGSQILPFYLKVESALLSQEAIPKVPLKIFYANVRTQSSQYESVSSLIAESNPDLVLLLELDSRWNAELKLSEKYSYSHTILREDNFGMGIFSRFPFSSDGVQDFGADLVPALMVNLVIKENKVLKTILLHCLPPLSENARYINRLLLRRISTKARFEEKPILIAGDFNATPFSPPYKKFMEWTDLSNVMWGKGLYRTWNAENPLIRLTIDHLLHSSNIKVREAAVLEYIGSDHLPYLVDVEL